MSLIRYIFVLLLLGSFFAASTAVAATAVGATPVFADEGKQKAEEDEEPECD